MNESTCRIQKYYDENVLKEWQRLERHPYEFILTTRMMQRYIQPGDRILDIGGGPGRYSLHFAQMGCKVTLIDLSSNNIAFAREQAQARGVCITALAGDCLQLDSLLHGEFDHVFLMGPLYHLTEDTLRVQAVQTALRHLRPGGLLYASFILDFAGLIYDMKNGPGFLQQDLDNPQTAPLIDSIIRGTVYEGPAFTDACFINQRQILPFMAQFNLEKLHLFGQEGILAPNENALLTYPQPEQQLWLDLAEKLLEHPEYLSFSEHAMYIGRKPDSADGCPVQILQK